MKESVFCVSQVCIIIIPNNAQALEPVGRAPIIGSTKTCVTLYTCMHVTIATLCYMHLFDFLWLLSP